MDELMERTDLLDTSEAAWRVLLERLREMTPEERVRKTFEMMEAGREIRRQTEDLRTPRERP